MTQVGPSDGRRHPADPVHPDGHDPGRQRDPDLGRRRHRRSRPHSRQAMAAGIKVVGYDSSPAVGAYNVFVNQADTNGIGAGLADMACDLAPELHRRDRRPVGRADGDQPERVDRRHEDDPRRSEVRRPQARRRRLRQRRPDRSAPSRRRRCSRRTRTSRSSWRPTTVGIVAAAQVVTRQQPHRQGRRDRPRHPEGMQTYVKSGAAPEFALWNVTDLGYLAYAVRRPAGQRHDHGHRGETFTVRSSTAASRTRSARTASSSSGRRSCSTPTTSTST